MKLNNLHKLIWLWGASFPFLGKLCLQYIKLWSEIDILPAYDQMTISTEIIRS